MKALVLIAGLMLALVATPADAARTPVTLVVTSTLGTETGTIPAHSTVKRDMANFATDTSMIGATSVSALLPDGIVLTGYGKTGTTSWVWVWANVTDAPIHVPFLTYTLHRYTGR